MMGIDWSEFKVKLEQEPLPGEQAHARMSPMGRRMRFPDEVKQQARQSAVMILWHERNDDVLGTLIQRPEYEGVHSRQMAFPGGQVEPEDGSLLDTALRETHEEIGVSAERIDVVGRLTELYIPPSNFLVHPFMGVLAEPPVYRPDPLEVSEVVEFSLSDLHREDVVREVDVPTRQYGTMRVPAFILREKVVWGATAAILSEVRELLK